MAHYQDIDEYRKKKLAQRKKRLIMGFGLLVAALAVFLTVFFLVRSNRKSGISHDSTFPLLIHGEQLEDIYAVGNHLAVLTQSGLYIYDVNGTETYSVSHGCSNAAVYEAGDRLLTFDRGGTKLRVDDVKGNCGELTMENPILCAQIADDGTVLAITSHEQYVSYLQVYDDKMNLRYRYGSASESFSMAAFSPDQTHIAACAIESSNGSFMASISVFDYTSEQTAQTYQIPDILPLYMTYTSSSGLIVVGTDRIAFLNTDTGESSVTEYEGTLQQFVCGSSDVTAIVTDNPLNGASALTLFDQDGREIETTAVSDSPIDLCLTNNRILLLGRKMVYHYNLSLELQEEIPLESSAQKITYTGGSMFLLGADTISKYSIR